MNMLSPHLIDFIMCLIGVEAIALSAFNMITGRGIAPTKIIANLLAGFALFFALRVVISGGPWILVGLCLFASLVAHLSDLSIRWTSVNPETSAARSDSADSKIPLANL
jgi:hypothetical protein